MARKTGGAGTKPKRSKSTKKRLTKDELFERLAPRSEEFELPEEAGGGTILLRGLSGPQGFEQLKGLDDKDDLERIKRLLMMGIVEPELDLDDVSRLAESSAGLLERIGNRIMDLSGFQMAGLEAFLALIQQQKESSSGASKS